MLCLFCVLYVYTLLALDALQVRSVARCTLRTWRPKILAPAAASGTPRHKIYSRVFLRSFNRRIIKN